MGITANALLQQVNGCQLPREPVLYGQAFFILWLLSNSCGRSQ